MPCDDQALKIKFGEHRLVQIVADIRHDWPQPAATKWRRHDNWEHLMGKNWTLIGPAGTGKSYLLLQIAKRLRDQGKKCYMVAFTNAVCCQLSEAVTMHKFCNMAYKGELENGATVIVDDVFFGVNTFKCKLD